MNHEGVVNPDGLKNWFVAVANRENVPAGMYRPVRALNPDPTIWATYQAGLRARATGNVAYLPVQPPWPDLYANTANSLMYEVAAPLHPNYAGHTALADLIFQAITPPRPTVPAGTFLPLTPKAVLP